MSSAHFGDLPRRRWASSTHPVALAAAPPTTAAVTTAAAAPEMTASMSTSITMRRRVGEVRVTRVEQVIPWLRLTVAG
ncbi:MAG TPA: hypothetical protein VGN19_02830 [Pedococcus sp.]|nr:hypothetical protein [Pedococcus sp.]